MFLALRPPALLLPSPPSSPPSHLLRQNILTPLTLTSLIVTPRTLHLSLSSSPPPHIYHTHTSHLSSFIHTPHTHTSHLSSPIHTPHAIVICAHATGAASTGRSWAEGVRARVAAGSLWVAASGGACCHGRSLALATPNRQDPPQIHTGF